MVHDWEALRQDLAAWEIVPDERQLAQLGTYYDLLSETNAVMNLTAITSFSDFCRLHVTDSAAALYYGPDQMSGARSLIDIGSGAGFPGLVLKILQPALRVTLLDAQEKRVRFLQKLILALEVKGAEAVHARAEDLARDPAYREQYDLSTSRAVAALPALAEYALPFLKTGGSFVAYKSSDTDAELSQADHAVLVLGGAHPVAEDYVLPGSDIMRRLVFVQKKEPTDERYPRRAGIPAKKPL